MLDVEKIRQDFPLLHQTIHGKPLVYFDNAATTQKPVSVIDAIQHYYCFDNANIHRGVHSLSERATQAYEDARIAVQHFINARSLQEIIFTKGTTESINLVAYSLGLSQFKASDEILISQLEHHANIVPWQLLCERVGCQLKVIPITDNGEIILEEYKKLLSPKTKLVAVNHISNALGTINPIKEMISLAHDAGALFLVDGAQAVLHRPVDVQALDCDFYAFSGHKLLGPTGIGILYGKKQLLEAMPPYQSGGDMIRRVSFTEKTTFNELPYKFEAGTPPIAAAIGLGAAIRYIEKIGLSVIAEQENALLKYATECLLAMPEIKIVGNTKNKSAVISFLFKNVHPHDVGTILDHEGVAVRSGHHCAMPLMDRLGVSATTRASFAFYNTKDEIDQFIFALKKVNEVFN